MPKIFSAALVGLSAKIVEIEADISPGLPNTIIVGLPDASVQEARERVKSAVKNAAVTYPRTRVAINLAPADLPKNGSHYDLPIALAILLNSGQIECNTDSTLIVGELALDGGIRSVVGLLPVILMAKEKGFAKVIIPAANQTEAALVDGIEIIPVRHLIEVLDYLQGRCVINPLKQIDWTSILNQPKDVIDFKLISGQEAAKRALEIAAAGGHNVMLSGPPGTGKTLLAKALPSILPTMAIDEILEVTKIYSISGLLNSDHNIIATRPFRSPHHSSSGVALIGGGSSPRPGEISLAHRGVLFLDELPEFPRSVLENLRQPLEDGLVTVARASGTVVYPAQFILVAAQNPCPCGYKNSPTQSCVCTINQILNYQRKISGPLLDRMDMFIEVSQIEYEKLSNGKEAKETSADIRSRVEQARLKQRARFANTKLVTNSEMGVKEIMALCRLGLEEQKFMKQAALKLNLSARAYHRVMKLALTIADLCGDDQIKAAHLAEALQYRTRADQ